MKTNFRVVQGGLEDDFGDLFVPRILFSSGGLWTWGTNNWGQLGDGTTINKSSPVQTIAAGTNWKQVAAGEYCSTAIKTDGTLWTWGFNLEGQIGDNTTISKSSPVQTIAGGTNWKQVSVSRHVAAIKTDGTLWTWGSNVYGQLGDGTTIDKSSPVQTIAAGTNWKQVAAGSGITAVIKTDGTLWMWGNNGYGQLGDGTRITKSSPVQTIAGGTNWAQVSISGFRFVAAIKTDGTLWTWGSNYYSGLGDGTTIDKSSPVQTIAGGTNWKQVSGSSAIKTDGTLWVWGFNNYYGNLGDGTTISKSSPVQTIAGGTNWKQVSGSSAIKTDGTLWTWGYNNDGSLGDGTTIDKSSPVQTIAGGTNWKQVVNGNPSMAITDIY